MDATYVPPFLRLPTELRQKIYNCLLAAQPDEDVTTINYELVWPYLEHPSSSTFTAHQLDRCRCPKQKGHHIYTRYACCGPEIRYTSGDKKLWVLAQSGVHFNILRPASQQEIELRPSASIVRVNKLIYEEAVPILYRQRNFLLLSGPSPRGRYQAYATQRWLSQMTSLARAQVTDLSLICQAFEEDCRDDVAAQSYASFSRYLLSSLPRCGTLHFLGWDENLPVETFTILFQRTGMKIVAKKRIHDKRHMFECSDAPTFLKSAGFEDYDDAEALGRLYELYSQEKAIGDRAIE